MVGSIAKDSKETNHEATPRTSMMMSTANVKSLDTRDASIDYDFVIALPSDPVWKKLTMTSSVVGKRKNGVMMKGGMAIRAVMT